MIIIMYIIIHRYTRHKFYTIIVQATIDVNSVQHSCLLRH